MICNLFNNRKDYFLKYSGKFEIVLLYERYNVYCIMYNVYCIMYNVYYILYNV